MHQEEVANSKQETAAEKASTPLEVILGTVTDSEAREVNQGIDTSEPIEQALLSSETGDVIMTSKLNGNSNKSDLQSSLITFNMDFDNEQSVTKSRSFAAASNDNNNNNYDSDNSHNGKKRNKNNNNSHSLSLTGTNNMESPQTRSGLTGYGTQNEMVECSDNRGIAIASGNKNNNSNNNSKDDFDELLPLHKEQKTPNYTDEESMNSNDERKKKGLLNGVQFALMLFVVTCAGPFGIEAVVQASSPFYALLAILLVPFVYCLPQGLMCAELSSMIPSNHGSLGWVYRGLGNYCGFIYAVNNSFSTLVDIPTYIVLIGTYTNSWLIKTFSDGNVLHDEAALIVYIFEVFVVFIATLLNLRNVTVVGNATALLVAFILIPPFIGFFLVLYKIEPKVWFDTTTIEDCGNGHEGVCDWTLYFSSIIWLHTGWDTLSNINGEVGFNLASFMKAFATAIAMDFAAYFIPLMTIFTIAFPESSDYTNVANWKDGYLTTAFFDISPVLGYLVFVGSFFSNFSVHLCESCTLARELWAMAQDSAPPSKSLSKIKNMATLRPGESDIASSSAIGHTHAEKFEQLPLGSPGATPGDSETTPTDDLNASAAASTGPAAASGANANNYENDRNDVYDIEAEMPGPGLARAQGIQDFDNPHVHFAEPTRLGDENKHDDNDMDHSIAIGILPRWFGILNRRTRAPTFSIIFIFIANCILMRFSFEFLVELNTVQNCFSFILEYSSLVALRYKEPDEPRPFTIPGGYFGVWFVTIIKFFLVGALITVVSIEKPEILLFVFGFNVITLLYYVLWVKPNNKKKINARKNETMMASASQLNGSFVNTTTGQQQQQQGSFIKTNPMSPSGTSQLPLKQGSLSKSGNGKIAAAV